MRVLVVAQLAVLRVLLDRIKGLARRDLKLGARKLGDLGHHVHIPVGRVERDIMPRRDLLELSVVIVVELHPKVERPRLAGRRGGQVLDVKR